MDVSVPDRNDLIVEHVPHYRGWLHTVAYSLLGPDHPGHEDLMQEGFIAMWRAVGTHDPARSPLGAWMRFKARGRMVEVRNGHKRYLGSEPRTVATNYRGRETRERIADYLRAHPAASGREISEALGISQAAVSTQRRNLAADAPDPGTTSLDALLDEGFDPTAADDLLQHVLDGYHRGEIVRALDVLTPAERRYVTMRFWGGRTKAEMTAVFGYDPHSLWRSARERLRVALSDLVEV